MKLSIRQPLFGNDGAELTVMLADNLRETGWTKGSGTVLLCDHGSPIPEVTACRNALAKDLREHFRLESDELIACSMERREGAEYDFNEPLLEDALQSAKGEAVILMLFLLPGRHAGPDSDVATIAKEHAPAGLRWKLSPLLGDNPFLASLLEKRLAGERTFDWKRRWIYLPLLFALPFLLSRLLPTPWDHGILLHAATLLIVLTPLLYFRTRHRKKA